MSSSLLLQKVFNITGIGLVVVGKVEGSSSLKVGMKANVDGSVYQVKSIEANHQAFQTIEPGNKVGLHLVQTEAQTTSPIIQKKGFFQKIFSPKQKTVLEMNIGKYLKFN